MADKAGKETQIPTIAGRVTRAMRKIGVSPLPRNYELFYEALIGNNLRLQAELGALGLAPSQEGVDAIYDKYLKPLHPTTQVGAVHGRIADELDGLFGLLTREQQSLAAHGKSLSEISLELASSTQKTPERVGQSVSSLQSETRQAIEVHADIIDGVAKASDELQILQKELNEYKRIANIDSLTGLFNRRAFDERLSRLFGSRERQAGSALILADIDHFKRFNDTYGHPVGDRVLILVARVLRSYASKNVFVARPGGEEFALLVEKMQPAEVLRMAESVRRDVEAGCLFRKDEQKAPVTITISLGVSLASEADSSDGFYRDADLALYSAKNGGRNCVRKYDSRMSGNSANGRMMYRDEG